MKIVRKIEKLGTVKEPVVIAAGTLDGIHIGHKKVIETAVTHARKTNSSAWVLTFDPHPKRTLQSDDSPLLLTSLSHKLRLIEALDIDGCLLISFDRELRSLSPEEFVAQLSEAIPGLSEIVAGENWTFGREADGTIELLRELGAKYQFTVTAVEPVLFEQHPVSSTRIRDAVVNGRLDEAQSMLGRPFSILGTVVEGHKIGRELGYPTANIVSGGEITPPPGIYAVYAIINGRRHNGVAYYGSRPTFDDETHDLTLEIHLFDGFFELYSHEMEVFFVRYIRSDQQFDSRGQLIATIEADCQKAREILRGQSA